LGACFPAGSSLDFVKIDIEGAEAKALAGVRRLLHELRPILLIEFHREAGWAGGHQLLSERYNVYDMNGRNVSSNPQRPCHILALPDEKDATRH
jgi:hypothetical protein